MKKILFMSILLLLSVFYSKTMAQEAVLSAGGNTTQSNGSVSYSIGQVFSSDAESSDHYVTEGVQQAFEIYVVTEIEALAKTMDLLVYPNPTSDFLKLKTSEEAFETLSFVLTNVQGQVLQTQKVNQKETRVNLKNYAPGSYFLNIRTEEETIKTFKIIRK